MFIDYIRMLFADPGINATCVQYKLKKGSKDDLKEKNLKRKLKIKFCCFHAVVPLKDPSIHVPFRHLSTVGLRIDIVEAWVIRSNSAQVII